MTIFFLMSPHYYPEWALTNHPEAAWNSGSFLRFDVQHPYSRKLLEAYYRKVITTLRNSPGAGAIHSICISNEPQYRPSLRRPFTRDRFISYLKRHYGEVAKLNAAYGSNYGSFAAAAPSVDPTFDTKPKGLYYDFLSFRQDEFADWHTWMASLVKELWPGMAVHCKQLGGFGLEFSTDFERFSKFSTVHGTDTGIVFGGDESGISRGDYCDALMTSFSPVHIVNSETHLSPDRYEKPIPYNIFYTCLFQQFMLGVGGATVWVWEDYGYDLFKERHDFVGSIYRRPMGILAIRDATADANRLIYEIRDTFNVKPEIAILYSMPSKIYRSEYENDAAAVWNAFNYTGRKVGFISEAQLQAGQLGATKIIVAPGTANVMPATAQALTKFTAKGGKIVKLGDCFAWNQYGRALTESVPAAKLDVALLKQPNQLAVELAKVADTVLGPLPVQVFAPGVEWRCTPMKDGFSLVYLVNWSSKPLPVKLSAVGTDLISGHSMPKTFELPSLKPVLLKIKH